MSGILHREVLAIKHCLRIQMTIHLHPNLGLTRMPRCLEKEDESWPKEFGGGGEVLYVNVKAGKQGDICVQGLNKSWGLETHQVNTSTA